MNNHSWAGSEVLWSEAASYLHGRGFPVAIACPWWPEPSRFIAGALGWKTPVFQYRNHTSRLQRILSYLHLQRGPGDFRRRWLRTIQPAFLLLSNGMPYQGLAWMEAAVAEGIPFASLAQAHAEFVSPNDDLVDRLIACFQKASLNLFVSHANQKLLEAQLGIKVPNSRVVSNHSANLVRDPLPWPEDSDSVLRLACVGRLYFGAKGQDLLMSVLSSPAWQQRRWTLTFCGTGPQERVLRRLVANANLQDRVTFMGQVPDITTIWATHHALVLPSRYEGMPLAVVEAALAGRLVISTAVAGIPELIRHSDTGFLAEAATEHHLAVAMEQAWDARENWRHIASRGRQAVEQRVDPNPGRHLAEMLLEQVKV